MESFAVVPVFPVSRMWLTIQQDLDRRAISAGFVQTEYFITGRPDPVTKKLDHGLVLILNPVVKIFYGDAFIQTFKHRAEFLTLAFKLAFDCVYFTTALYRHQQFFNLNRLDKIIAESERDCRNETVGLANCRGCNYLGICIQCLDLADQLKSAHTRHIDISDNNRRAQFLEFPESVNAIVRSNHPGAGLQKHS